MLCLHATSGAGKSSVLRAGLVAAYESTHGTPYPAAERGYVDDVIRPSETRRVLCEALAMSHTKRVERPKRRHGNIPL